MDKVKGLVIGTGIGAFAGLVLSFGLAAVGEWSFYSHEYAYAGVKFAPSTEAGCGIELPTELGRAVGLDWPLYCEQGGGIGYVEGWFTTTDEDDTWEDTYAE